MQNDAKFGLVVGVGLVVACAALFFQRSPSSGQAAPPAQIASESQKHQPTAPAMLPAPASLPKPSRTSNDKLTP